MELLSAFVSTVLICVVSAGNTPWTYSGGDLDQMHWANKYPDCGGKKQSPIDIQRRSVKCNSDLLQLQLSGSDAQRRSFLMTNNGHSLQIDLPPTMMITKGLPDKYTAVDMYLHWGDWNQQTGGSEHTIDSIGYMAELHVMYYNSDKYSSFSEAQDKPGGQAGLAFFIVDGPFDNPYYDDFISNLDNIKFAGKSTNLLNMNLRSMLPENLNHFFRYEGSTSVPPCYESVIWTVFDTPITLSQKQLKKLMTTLMNSDNKILSNNYRFPQPLNDRMVESSFLPRYGKRRL